MSADPLLILDALLAHHPELIALRDRGGVARELAAAAPGLARVLLGVATQADHPLIDALLAPAAAEVAILTGLCRGHRMRTLTTTVSLLLYLADLLEPPPTPDDAADTPDAGGNVLAGGPMLAHAFEAVARQGQAMEALERLLPDMGWGFGRGHLEEAVLQDMARFAALLERAESLRRIADELGRLETRSRRPPSPQRGGRDAVVGVRLGGNLSEALPTELALLSTPGAEDLFYQRYIDHRLLSLEFDGTVAEPVRRGGAGPVIACVDTSGSMAGVPETLAKALILAVMRRVLPQGRRVRLMLFGGPGDFQDRDIGRGPSAMKHFLDFLAMGFHAGTDFDGPLERALDLLAEERYERADILLVTDGYASAGQETIQRVHRLRRELGFSVVSVVIGGSPRGVAPFSDRVWTLPATPGALQGISLQEWDRPDDP